jgi:hypothetical protein
MFDPYNDSSRKKLYSAIKGSQESMKPFYEKAKEAYTEYVGKHYANGTEMGRPLNMIELAYTIYQQNLVASAPQVNVTALDRQYRPDAAALKLAINKHLRHSNLQEEMECWVMEAMFSPMGIIKLSLNMEDVQEIDGMEVVGGLPTVTAILHDDWVQDMRAKSPWSVAFCGDRYSVSREFAMQHFDPEAVRKLPKESEQREAYASQKLSTRESHSEDDAYRDMLQVWDIWLPYEGLVLTIPGDFDHMRPPLNVVEWTGPKRGPYHRLFFGQVPGNSMPLPPVALWRDLNDVINCTSNKLIDQIERMRKNILVDGTDPGFAQAFKDAADGEGLTVQGLQGVKEVVTGGLDQPSFAAMLQFKQIFSYMAGNLDALGGLQAMSGTVGQDKLLSEGASQRIKRMQGKMYVAAQHLCSDIAEYFWSDPTMRFPITQPIQGTSETVDTMWSRADMRGTPDDYQLLVEPTSMNKLSPREKLGQIVEYWNLMIASLPVFQAAGMVPNPEGFHKLYIQLSDLPELADTMTFTQGEVQEPVHGKTLPSQTKRTYERVNRGSSTQAGQEARMIQSMMSGSDSMQPSEAAIGVPG